MLRIADANLNRLRESLRLLEDVARFLLNDAALAAECKALRHELSRRDMSVQKALLSARRADSDVGASAEVAQETQREDLPSIVLASSKRAQEALRSLEELGKLPDLRLDWEAYKKARFQLYSLEQRLLSAVLRRQQAERLSGLYVIVDHEAARGRSEIDIARSALAGGARIVQLRDKVRDKGLVLPMARAIQSLCAQGGALFIVNDHADLAAACGADGVHVGQHDLPMKEARALLPIDRLVGTSVDTVEEALRAQAQGADYIAVGSIFPTPTKADAVLAGLETLKQVKKAVSAPVVAIGGINAGNIARVVEAGADAVAVVSAVAGAQDPEAATRELVSLIKAAQKKERTPHGNPRKRKAGKHLGEDTQ